MEMAIRSTQVLFVTILTIIALLSCTRETIVTPEDTIFGTWLRRITDAQNQQFDAELIIKSDNTFDFILLQTVPGHNNSSGQFTLKGEFFTVINDVDCGVDGTYQFVVSDTKLAFVAVADACAPRQLVLQGVWSKR
jgi:hypothetical protein